VSNLYQRGSAWYGRLVFRGREYRESLRTADRKEAEARFTVWRQRIEAGGEAAPDRVSFMAAVVAWDQTFLSKPESVKPGTAKRYRVSLRNLDADFGSLALEEITRRRVATFVQRRAREGVSNATIRRDLTALSSILRFSVASGWIDHNPAREWDRSVIREKRPPQAPPAPAAVRVALGYARAPMRQLAAFLAASGVRLNEAVTLEWSQVDLAAGVAQLTRTKTNRPRVIRLQTIAGDAAAVLQASKRYPGTDLVFWHDDGQPFRGASKDFGQLIARVVRLEAKAGRTFRRFRAHDLRHAFAIRWLRAGGDIYELSRHLGHTSVKTTEIYLQWLDAPDGFSDRAQPPAQVSGF
jgi:integrase/recombinase XerD